MPHMAVGFAGSMMLLSSSLPHQGGGLPSYLLECAVLQPGGAEPQYGEPMSQGDGTLETLISA